MREAESIIMNSNLNHEYLGIVSIYSYKKTCLCYILWKVEFLIDFDVNDDLTIFLFSFLSKTGDPVFVDLALKFAYGNNSKPLIENRVAATQTLSGTGGLRIMGELLKGGNHNVIYLPNPTWGNHIPIFKNAGMDVRKYSYYDTEMSGINFDKMRKDIMDMPKGSVILLHACAHNPTG